MKSFASLTSCVILSVCTSFNLMAQNLWTYESESSFEKRSKSDIKPIKYKTFVLDFDKAKEELINAPHEKDISLSQSTFFIKLPNPEGSSKNFKLLEYDMMEEGLASKYPHIKTYYGTAIKDPFTRVRLDITERGLRAMIFSPSGNYYIDNYNGKNQSQYLVYFKSDYPAPIEKFKCETEAQIGDHSLEGGTQLSARAGDCTFRSYRLAMATTGEYSNFHGATSSSQSGIILSEVITSMNRVNGIYEIDATVRMILVANTDQLFYYNGGTDPYTNSNGGTMLSENQTNLDNIIGSSNYDIGHVYSTGGGGVAFLRSVCGGSKAGGVTGLGSPINDPFYVDYVAHEMGHQFGGNHTQNNNCQRSSKSYEPGSASTIMGYAGICNPNVQNNSDDYFHGASVQEIGNFITTGNGNNCDVPLPLTNSAPTVDAGDDYVIPVSTPFVLTAIGDDPDEHPLSYCWEQWDPEPGSMPPNPTNTVGPV